MPYVLYLIVSLARALLRLVQLAMLGRALLSWIPDVAEEGLLPTLLYAVTEPFIYPLRVLFHKMGWFADMPLDMPFFFTAILLMMLNVWL